MKALTAIAAGVLAAAPAAAQEEILTAEEAHEVGLLAEQVPTLVIPLDELVSKEDLLERIAEHVAAIGDKSRATVGEPRQESVIGDRAFRPGGWVGGVDGQPLIPHDLARILDAVEAGDDDRLREVLSDMAGFEVKLSTAEQRRQHDEGTIYKPSERYTTDEILARMRPEHVEALADHRQLLDDEWELIDALSSGNKLDSRTRSAAREFLAKMRDPEPVESILPPELKEQIRKAQERGWYEVASPARGARLLREASQLELARSSLSTYDEYIPETASSYSFDLPHGRIEVVADTVFGGVLYAEKSEAAHVYPDDPNLHILGHDGSVTTSRHADGVWATTVTAFDGSHMYQITLEKKLEGEERDEFVRMATVMIEGDFGVARTR